MINTAKAEMLIRRPLAEVFEAFVDPSVTTRFWFTGSSGRLEQGETVQWEWGMYNLVADIRVEIIEPDSRIVFEWKGPAGEGRTVEWEFSARGSQRTVVAVRESGFVSEGDALIEEILDSSRGFTLVLTAAKAWLEFGADLNIVEDSHPGKPPQGDS